MAINYNKVEKLKDTTKNKKENNKFQTIRREYFYIRKINITTVKNTHFRLFIKHQSFLSRNVKFHPDIGNSCLTLVEELN